ncbi:MAG: tetratricopeptide repeat protein [Symploca sp. SIO2B6]|nr:tetratricopeptide repeat protein [Symploca sp. SIO2B6]
MSQKRSPWIILVLVLTVFTFVGLLMVPLLGGFFQENQPSAGANQGAIPTISPQERSELELQAKGYELVLQREPDNKTALLELLETRLKLGDIPGAITPLERLAKLNTDQTEYGVLLAQAKQQIGDREGAAQAYRSILKSHPGDMNALQGLVNLLLQQSRPEAAIGLLQDTLKTAVPINEIKPGTVNVASVQLLLGEVYATQKRYTEAIAIYDQSIKGNQQDWRPVLAKALILKEQGKIAEAEPLFKQAISLAPAKYKDQIKQRAEESSQPPTSSPSNTTLDRRETLSNDSQ